MLPFSSMASVALFFNISNAPLYSLDWKWPRNWNYVQLWCNCISSAFRSQKQTKHFDKSWKRTFLFLIRSTFASTIIVKLRPNSQSWKPGLDLFVLFPFAKIGAMPWCDFDKLSDPLDILIKIMLNGFPFIDQTWNWDITKPSRNTDNKGSVKQYTQWINQFLLIVEIEVLVKSFKICHTVYSISKIVHVMDPRLEYFWIHWLLLQ